jgi:phage terminase large subunit GpA-like protein
MLGLPDARPLRPFASAAAVWRAAAEVLVPPRRMTVTEAASAYRYLRNPGGGYTGPWERLPYLVKPADETNSRRRRGVVFAGPAQSAKTDGLILNPIVYGVMCDPADTLVVQTNRFMARDFSVRRIDRMNDDSEEVGARLDRSRDNTFDKAIAG